MSEDRVRALVIGGGVVGAAVAQKLAQKGMKPLVLDMNPIAGEGVTSRNSGVIHAGIYYPPGSKKAVACLEGKNKLKSWCRAHDVPWRETGKWIIAQDSERASLEETMENALRSGASGLEWKTESEIRAALPGVRGSHAIYSSETGIVDPYAFTRSLLDDACRNGADEVLSTRVLEIRRQSDFYTVLTTRGDIAAERIFNCAGLYADEIAAMVGLDQYRIFPWRGDYFRIDRDLGIRTLIYPVKVKNAPGLGIHLTVGLDGSCRLGPDVEPVASKGDFTPRPEKLGKFLEAARVYLPSLTAADLSYDTCGIRPKLRGPSDRFEKDFVVQEDLPGFVNLIGIESPGLTAAMALADEAVRLSSR